MKHSVKLTKALLSLMMSLGSQAFAKDQSIISETLLKNNLDEATIQELISENILLKAKLQNRLALNNEKVAVILEASEDIELQQLAQWLKSVVGQECNITTQKPDGMVITSQDGGSIQ